MGQLVHFPPDISSADGIVFDVVMRKARKLPLSGWERRINHLFRYGVRAWGRWIFESPDLDALEDRVEAAIEHPAFPRLLELIAIETGRRPPGLPAPLEPKDELVTAFGPDRRGALIEGLRLNAAMSDAAAQLHAEPALREALGAVLVYDFRKGHLAFVEDPRTPPAVARAWLDAYKVTAYFLSMCHALYEARQPPAVLGAALVGGWVESQRSALLVLASLPGLHIAEDVIPAADRLDLAALRQQTDAAEEGFRRLGERARASGEAVYAPFGKPEPDDE